jgi:hypothetical protein
MQDPSGAPRAARLSPLSALFVSFAGGVLGPVAIAGMASVFAEIATRAIYVTGLFLR